MLVLVLGALVALTSSWAPAAAQVAQTPEQEQDPEQEPEQEPAPVTDPGYSLQWGLGAIGAPDAWHVLSGRGVIIAVIDSGVDLDHEDLAGQLEPGGNATCIGTGGDPGLCTAGGHDDGRDDAGHGTHVAGIALAATGNGVGVAGLAPGARLMPVRVLEESCGVLGCEPSGNADDVAAGIRWAVANGADVINLSLGNTTQGLVGPAFREAVRAAWEAGAVTVVAAGNDIVLPSGFTDEPALVVAALDRAGQAAAYSNGVGEAQWALSAPGGEEDTDQTCNSGAPRGIVSTYFDATTPGDDYFCLAGTSMAASFVSGAAALLLSAGLTPQQTVDRLLATATDLGRSGADETYGAGALDVATAVRGLRPSAPTTSPTSTTEPEQATTTSELQLTPTTPVPVAATTTTSAPPPTSLPATTEVAGAPTAPPGGGRGEDGLPALAVSVAALLVVAVGAASAWLLVRNAGWARRTPG